MDKPVDPIQQYLPLDAATAGRLDAFWRACNYLAAGMIYLRAPAPA